jgi:hypothetical protein
MASSKRSLVFADLGHDAVVVPWFVQPEFVAELINNVVEIIEAGEIQNVGILTRSPT